MTTRRLALISITLAVAASCAYYNIFWMAKNEYKRVMSSPEVSDFWDPFTQKKVTGENAKLLTSVTKRCGKILLLYPESKWVDDALLMMGNCFVLKQEYGSAMRKYDELLNLYASSELVDRARYMKAYTLILQDSHKQALAELDNLVRGTKDKLIREQATYLRGLVYHNKADCKNAITHFETYLTEFGAGRKAKQVRLALGACLLRTGRPDQAIEVLEPVAGKPDTDGLTAGLQIGRAHRQLGRYETAVEVFEDIAVRSVEDTIRARAKIETAEVLLEQQNSEEAIKTLSEADSLLAKDARDLKAEVNYTIGFIYEKHLGDFDKAMTSYSAATGSQSKFSTLAAGRTKALNDMQSYRQALSDSIPDSPEEQAKTRFMLAEIYLEDLGLRTEALEQYKSVADSFPASSYAAKSMLATGSLLEAAGDTLGRIYYRAVIDSFPNTIYANLARSSLDLPLVDIVMEVPYTASAEDSISASEIPTVPLPGTPAVAVPEIPTVVRPEPSSETALRDSLARARSKHAEERETQRRQQPGGDRTWEIGPPQPSARDTTEARKPGKRDLPPPQPAVAESPPTSENAAHASTPDDSLEMPALEDTLEVAAREDTLKEPAPEDTLRVPTAEDTLEAPEVEEPGQ